MKKWTGERLETFVFNDVTVEHLHRYALAREIVHGKNVLDIACGEGYGSNLLAENAISVTGIDIDEKTIEDAQKKYAKSNLNFLVGRAESIPAPSQQFDIVVSFETIEHIFQHEQMVKEIKRVLKPGGILIISTPNIEYKANQMFLPNPFHVKELNKQNFLHLLKSFFSNVEVADQYMVPGSLVISGSAESIHAYEGEFESIKTIEGFTSFYMIAVASDSLLPQIGNSIFSWKRTLELAVHEKEELLKKTWTYRVGHALLLPFKIIRSFFNQNTQ